MTRTSFHFAGRSRTSGFGGFTLVELIVVMVVMAILAGLSAMAYRGIAADLRMSSAINTVTSALDNARAIAIKKNRYVIAVFVPRLINNETEQVIDIVLAAWHGDSMNADRGDGDVWTYDRYVPIRGLQPRSLDVGINVAAPSYQSTGSSGDDDWLTPTYLPDVANVQSANAAHLVGRVSGILYSPEGRVVTRNSQTGSDRQWVDFNIDGEQTWDPDMDRNPDTDDPWDVGWLTNPPPAIPVIDDPDGDVPVPVYGVLLKGPGGEPFIMTVPFISIFDEEEFRTLHSPNDWDDWENRIAAYTGYIEENAERIQFNRYSGVQLK
jgi:prepilin-type N-terminal cleavage/methylation domain-containing protein